MFKFQQQQKKIKLHYYGYARYSIFRKYYDKYK